MYIVQIASEIAPIAKVGGLADVMLGLSRCERQKGHRVEVLVPKYDTIQGSFTKIHEKVPSYFQGKWHDNTIWSLNVVPDLSVTFIEPHHPARFFERGEIYGFADDNDRFLYFCRACLDFLKGQKKIPDVIHLHDWETAAISFLIRMPEFKEIFSKTRVVFTIHNLAYQGRCAGFNLDDVGFVGDKECFKCVKLGDYNLMKAGIVSSDVVTTVSPTYSREVVTPQYGEGLESVLLKHAKKFFGILNGLDATYWDPKKDPLLDFPYAATDPAGKKKNKVAFLKAHKMQTEEDLPLVASICRLVPQKGVLLMKEALEYIEGQKAQYVILGTTNDPKILDTFTALSERYKTHPNIRIILKNEERLAHRLYAASDLFFVPSIFEPCGLTQLIALRYGSIPVVRRTGGLADTVVDVREGISKANGFTFDESSPASAIDALHRALLCANDQATWRALVDNGAKSDHSWESPTEEYLKLYSKNYA